jgi:hypothetical protein
LQGCPCSFGFRNRIDWLRLGLHRTLLRLPSTLDLRLLLTRILQLALRHLTTMAFLQVLGQWDGRRGRWLRLWGRSYRLRLCRVDNGGLGRWLWCRRRREHGRKIRLGRNWHLLNWRDNLLLGFHCYSFQ